MQLLKRWWFWVIVVVILVVFFIPKDAGHGGGSSFSGEIQIGEAWLEKECSCIGFKLIFRSPDGPTSYGCSGIPFSCKCFENKIEKDDSPIERKEISCE